MAAAYRHLRSILMLVALICVGWTSSATALPLSDFSSETNPPASVLDATVGFSVAGNQLTLTVANQTAAPDKYNINGVWWNGKDNVTGLTLVSATHSVAGDVTAVWSPVETASHVAGFGSFDFGLTLPSNEKKANLIGSGESIAFVFTIDGAGPFAASDFDDVPNDKGMVAAAKFVNGPHDWSAFGATNGSNTIPVPEPATAALLGAGLLGLGWAGRRSR